MPKPPKDIKAFKHTAAKRAHIPSAEEAGSEAASPAVKGAPAKVEIPLNPVVHRGQDPELFWLGKYGEQENAENPASTIDLRSIYRHEHIAPEQIIRGLHRTVEADAEQPDLLAHTTGDLFGNALSHDELEKIGHYYTHSDGWTNRLMQGDSLLCMASMLHREGMAGQVQTIYFDPPYGIKYGSNWQIALHDRTVTDGKDEHLTGEPEQVKAFRDTWELGIHSYLTYLRDRLLVARDLLTHSGSIFVQISDENVHLVRSLMDEVFGSGNFVAEIWFQTSTNQNTNTIQRLHDCLLWYSKSKDDLKVNRLFRERLQHETESTFNLVEQNTGKRYKAAQLKPGWKEKGGIDRLRQAGRLTENGRYAKRYANDFEYTEYTTMWAGTVLSTFASDKVYVVQTTRTTVERCLLMTSDPGDLVLDPTCGSGTTAYVAEQWGRRWITIDTSRIALNIAKTRLMTAVFPYYKLHDQERCDLRQGFVYKKVPHITLGSIANGEPPATETLYDQPEEIKSKLRISGPFTVETLQSYEPLSPEELAQERESDEGLAAFEDLVFSFLQSSGVMTGDKRERAVFTRVDRLASPSLHAEGFFSSQSSIHNPQSTIERKAYLHLGPKFGTVSKQAVSDAIKEARRKGDADWLLILGFSFESNLQDMQLDQGSFQVSIVRMHDDLLQDGLMKKDKKHASFVTIGEPDIGIVDSGSEIVDGRKTRSVQVEIRGLDIYDPIKDEVKSRAAHDIAYWMVDDDYDGTNFVVKQVFFSGGSKDEFAKWKKGLDALALGATKKRAERTLRIEIDEEAFERLYGTVSHPIRVNKPGQKIAVRCISQFGEETTKVMEV
jgi:adenine-specific DNA-methyltransferase